MPLSVVTKKLVRKSGYSVLIWALQVLLANEQFKLVAMVIISLCLIPRKSSLENNGVLAVLRNSKLSREGKKYEDLRWAIGDLADENKHYDKIGATLAATNWWRSCDFHLRGTDPVLFIDDSCMYFNTSRRDRLSNEEPYQDMLCDHAGCQFKEHYPHYRLTRDFDGDSVRVIGKQMNRYFVTITRAKPLPNGYFEYRVPSYTILYRMTDNMDGRTLTDVMEPGVWYNYYFKPDTPLDLEPNHPDWMDDLSEAPRS